MGTEVRPAPRRGPSLDGGGTATWCPALRLLAHRFFSSNFKADLGHAEEATPPSEGIPASGGPHRPEGRLPPLPAAAGSPQRPPAAAIPPTRPPRHLRPRHLLGHGPGLVSGGTIPHSPSGRREPPPAGGAGAGAGPNVGSPPPPPCGEAGRAPLRPRRAPLRPPRGGSPPPAPALPPLPPPPWQSRFQARQPLSPGRAAAPCPRPRCFLGATAPRLVLPGGARRLCLSGTASPGSKPPFQGKRGIPPPPASPGLKPPLTSFQSPGGEGGRVEGPEGLSRLGTL